MEKRLNRLPITFEKTGEVTSPDMRFINVSIDVLHTGDNKNGSTFSKEVVEAAADSIKNTPILGYIEENRSGDLDFKGHEHTLEIDDGDIKYVYSGSAYGVIPESCNPRWINKDDGTGTMRDYLRVDGLLWTKFDDSCDVFARDMEKPQSMEITDMDGYVDDRGYYVVQKFAFDGCCVLSSTDPGIRPAMTGSNVVANFSAATVAGQIKDMLAAYTVLQKSQSSKEAEIDNFAKGEDVLEEKNKILTTYGIDASALEFSLEEITIDELEKKCKEMSAGSKSGEGEDPTAAEPCAEPASEPVNEPAAEPVSEFSLTLNERMDEIRDAVRAIGVYTDEYGYEMPVYWTEDVQDDRVIVVSTKDWKKYAIPFAMDGDNIALDLDNKKRVKVQYADWDEGSKELALPVLYEEMGKQMGEMKKNKDEAEAKYTAVKSELDEMKPKYDAYVAAEAAAAKALEDEKREKLFAVMDKQLEGVAEYAALRENKDVEFSALEDECYKLLGKKAAEFSYVPTKKEEDGSKSVRFGVSGVQMKSADDKYGDLFKRYGVR